jgi:Tol biopolymer transport system component/C-terminal processing protease CtpA/Prc
MRFRTVLLLIALGASASLRIDGQAPPPAAAAARPSFAEPALSHDGREVAFVSGGDVWTVAASGGEARLLVSGPATESHPVYSPDGRSLAFVSTRTGTGDIYRLELASGDLRRLTFDDGPESLDAWSADGKWIYFTSSTGDVAGMNDVYRVAAQGGTPMAVTADRYVSEYFAAPSPDGKAVAFTARGISFGQWWRRGRSHIDEAEIWVWRDGMEGGSPSYERVTEGGAKQMWPMWSGDGRTLFYVSDRNGHQNLWAHPLGGTPRPLTRFTSGRVLWPSASGDGHTVVFERDFSIWTLDTASGKTATIPVTRRGMPTGPAVERLGATTQIQELSLSPDGKKVAFVVHGEVFAASAKDGGDAARVTRSAGSEGQVTWAPDSRRVVYASDREGAIHLFLYDFTTGAETRLTQGARDDAWPQFSPDGKRVAFLRGQEELRVLEVGGQERLVATGHFADRLASGRPLSWSPDGKWVALFAIGTKGFLNPHVVPADGAEMRPLAFLANSSGSSVSWSSDGTYVLFDTGQRTEPGQLARVDLTLRVPKLREDLFRELFEDETPRTQTPGRPGTPADPAKTAPPPAAAPEKAEPARATPAEARKPAAPVEIVFDQIRRRLTPVPVGVDVGEHAVSPDGKWVLLTAQAAGQTNLYTYSLDELSRERPVARQLTSTGGSKSFAQFTPDSKEVYYLEGGRIQVVTLERREPRPLAVTAEMDVDFAEEKLEVFQQAWAYQRDSFFDPAFNGADWNAVRQQYLPYARGAATSDELRRVISLMVGELNASHLGISGPATASPTTGRLGVRFDRAEYERAGRFKIREIISLGPLAVTRRVKVGEYLTAVDGTALGSGTNLDALLEHKIGRRVVLTVAVTPDGQDRREVVVRPASLTAEKGLLYRDWVEANRAYVHKASGGRLGYVHMVDMGAQSLAQLYVDLDAENHARDGVVVDIRNNNGGFVNVYAIDVFARRGYLTMRLRGRPAAPARPVLGQRALEAPTVLVTNQHSLSDAEDFTEGYRALGLGKVVGEPTAGWIVYTWNVRLIDGSSFRLPRTLVLGSDGSPMEMHARPVDVPVTRPIGEGLSGRDSQLDRAVTELLKTVRPRTN